MTNSSSSGSKPPQENHPSQKASNASRSRSLRQTFLDQSSDPLFVLKRRRLIYVNSAWEKLTGLQFSEVLGLVCSARSGDGSPLEQCLAKALAPPAETRRGAYARVSRSVAALPAPVRNWEIEFLPLGFRSGQVDQSDNSFTTHSYEADGEFLAGRDSQASSREDSLMILGRVRSAWGDDFFPSGPLPEILLPLRDHFVQRWGPGLLESQSPAVELAALQVELASQTMAPVLIRGERGAGKQTVARIIHYQSELRQGPFASMDAVRIPANLLESLLFGENGFLIRKGPGTIYLREPAALPRDLQGRLVLYLEQSKNAGFRLIAGIKGDPEIEIKEGRFLPEFHTRLATLAIQMPPLRDRFADLDRLAERMIEALVDPEVSQRRTITPEARRTLMLYSWPGNLRELFEVLSTACQTAAGDQLDVADWPEYLRLTAKVEPANLDVSSRTLPLDQILEQVEKRMIEQALRLANNNKSKAAEILGIPRARLLKRLEPES